MKEKNSMTKKCGVTLPDADLIKMIVEIHADVKLLKSINCEDKKIREQQQKDIDELKTFKAKMLAVGSILSIAAGFLGDWLKNKFF